MKCDGRQIQKGEIRNQKNR